MAFAYDFQQIANDPSRGSLHGKMAVLHFDGNGFGALQRELCGTWRAQQQFDRSLREHRRRLLDGLLERIEASPASWLGLEGTYRFETLLWGGDEGIFVVPAWQGWWLLEQFFAETAEWTALGEPLRHAAGLVFCHAKAPIRRIKELAEKLTGLAKEAGRDRNRAAFQVLESFDLAPEEFDRFRSDRSPGKVPSALIIEGDKATEIAASVRALAPVLPRGRVYRAVAKLTADPAAATAETAELRKIAQRAGEGEALDRLVSASATPGAAWFHLAELWDYLPAEEEATDAAH